MRGNRTIKYSTFAFGAFQSPHMQPLAEVGTSVRLGREALQPEGVFRVEGSFDPRVAVVWLTSGDDGATLRRLADGDEVAVLIAAFGCGNIPVKDRGVADGIRALVDAGKVVAIGSQSLSATVDLTRYAGGRLAQEAGAVGIGDMTLPAATVKLMYLAGTLANADETRAALTVPIAGEVTL
jgi:L-asparaginase